LPRPSAGWWQSQSMLTSWITIRIGAMFIIACQLNSSLTILMPYLPGMLLLHSTWISWARRYTHLLVKQSLNSNTVRHKTIIGPAISVHSQQESPALPGVCGQRDRWSHPILFWGYSELPPIFKSINQQQMDGHRNPSKCIMLRNRKIGLFGPICEFSTVSRHLYSEWKNKRRSISASGWKFVSCSNQLITPFPIKPEDQYH